MKKYVENMEKYEEICGKNGEIWREITIKEMKTLWLCPRSRTIKFNSGDVSIKLVIFIRPEENMEEYVENMKRYDGNMKEYEENMWKLKKYEGSMEK